jgi:hypothetical protein
MKKLAIVAVAATLAVAANAQWSDNFDGYANGQQLHGVGGWQGWENNAAAGATVTNSQSSSPPNSVNITGPSDLVQTFAGATSGIWQFSGDVYVPGNFTGQSYFIMLNTYGVGVHNWSLQMVFNGTTGNVENQGGSGNTVAQGNITVTTTPIVRDQWVPFDVTIDLDTNTHTGRYNNVTVVTGAWSAGAGSNVAIGAIDLFANNTTSVFYDNLELAIVPEPGTFVALGIGLAGLAALRRRK